MYEFELACRIVGFFTLCVFAIKLLYYWGSFVHNLTRHTYRYCKMKFEADKKYGDLLYDKYKTKTGKTFYVLAVLKTHWIDFAFLERGTKFESDYYYFDKYIWFVK